MSLYLYSVKQSYFINQQGEHDKIMPIVHRHCQGCGKLLTLNKSDVTPKNPQSKRFKGLYCGDCVQSYRHIPRFKLTCKGCGLTFMTTISTDEYCCLECKDLHYINKANIEAP